MLRHVSIIRQDSSLMMIEWSKHVGAFLKSFNVNNLSVCIGWCADQVTLRSARCKDKDSNYVYEWLF